MPGVVANAGPLMALSKLNLLHLLKALYGRVLLAASVYDEVVVEGLAGGFEDARTLQEFLGQEGWPASRVHDLPQALFGPALDRGERDSIALALEQEALLLIDEERGREVAVQLGLVVRGTLGVLIQAYRSGLIAADQLRFYFGQIEGRHDIWISPALCRRLLAQVLG
jgi:predicted nucleic acid-binding protein